MLHELFVFHGVQAEYQIGYLVVLFRDQPVGQIPAGNLNDIQLVSFQDGLTRKPFRAAFASGIGLDDQGFVLNRLLLIAPCGVHRRHAGDVREYPYRDPCSFHNPTTS
jgi:hypothetical protein